MKRLAVIALALSSCGGVKANTTPPEPDHLGGVLRVIGKYGNAAHACPVAPDVALTNAHVVDIRPFDAEFALVPYVWSDRQGREGRLDPDGMSKVRDIAVMHPVGSQFAQWYQKTTEPPKAGEPLQFLGYSWDNRKDAFGEKRFDVKVVRVVSGHVIYDPDGNPGSSGSCVLDSQDRVVAINAWGWEVGVQDHVGVGVGVWPIPGITQ